MTVFKQVSGAVDGLAIPLDRASIQTAVAIADRLNAKLAGAVGDYEAAGLHEPDGSVSMPTWLRHHCGRDPRSAHRLTATGCNSTTSPNCVTPPCQGGSPEGRSKSSSPTSPPGTSTASPTTRPNCSASLEALDVTQTAEVMTVWKAHADALDDGGLPAEHDNQVHLSRTLDGRGEIHASLDADLTATVDSRPRRRRPQRPRPAHAERRAEALDAVCRFFLDHQSTRPGGRHRPHLNVTSATRTSIDGLLDNATYLDTGRPSAPPSSVSCSATASCTGSFDGRSAILDYGRATRDRPSTCTTPSSPATTLPLPRLRPPRLAGPTPTTSTWDPDGPTSSTTSSCSADATTASSTDPAGTPNSSPTPPSRSPTPTDASKPPTTPAQRERRRQPGDG